jgi:hypothetical protein
VIDHVTEPTCLVEATRTRVSRTSLAFKYFEALRPTGTDVASLSIPSWNQIAGFLESMRRLRDSAGFAPREGRDFQRHRSR